MPGDLVGLDCKLEGVGKAWQVTACDCASTEHLSEDLPRRSEGRGDRRVLRDVAVYLEKAGWPLQRVLTDEGSAFKSDFR
ncbi:MAG: hypothetical protein ACX98W_11140 [bacterium]